MNRRERELRGWRFDSTERRAEQDKQNRQDRDHRRSSFPVGADVLVAPGGGLDSSWATIAKVLDDSRYLVRFGNGATMTVPASMCEGGS